MLEFNVERQILFNTSEVLQDNILILIVLALILNILIPLFVKIW